jgi:hypothetical protein
MISGRGRAIAHGRHGVGGDGVGGLHGHGALSSNDPCRRQQHREIRGGWGFKLWLAQ